MQSFLHKSDVITTGQGVELAKLIGVNVTTLTAPQWEVSIQANLSLPTHASFVSGFSSARDCRRGCGLGS